MSLHVIFIDNQGQQLSDITSNFTSVQIPQNAFIMRIADNSKSYSNSTLTKLFEIDNTFYSKVLEYTTKGDYPFIDISVSDFGGFTAIFNQLSAQFVGNNPPPDIYDFTGYGGSGSGGNIDFSTIVTALNSIATALSALTNLSNLSNLTQLANIITAINNKDNQSDIVSELRYIFTQNQSQACARNLNGIYNLSVFKGNFNSSSLSSLENVSRSNLRSALVNISNKMSIINDNYANNDSTLIGNKFLARLLTLSNIVGTSTTTASVFTQNSYLQDGFQNINNRLNDIEVKLEQNLPFATLTDVTLNVDTVKKVVTQELNEKE